MCVEVESNLVPAVPSVPESNLVPAVPSVPESNLVPAVPSVSVCALTGEGVEAALTSVCELLEDKYRQRTDTLDRDKLWLQGSGIHVHGSGQLDDKKGCC